MEKCKPLKKLLLSNNVGNNKIIHLISCYVSEYSIQIWTTFIHYPWENIAVIHKYSMISTTKLKTYNENMKTNQYYLWSVSLEMLEDNDFFL